VLGVTEYELISHRLIQRDTEGRCTFAGDLNKGEAFTCGTCLDRNPLSALRVLVFCGHGFCEKCMAKARAAYETALAEDPGLSFTCPSCRKHVEEGVKVLL
jgi:hypothetical protein